MAEQAQEYDAQGKPLPAAPAPALEYDASGKPLRVSTPAPAAQPKQGFLKTGTDILKGVGEGVIHTMGIADDFSAKHLPTWFTTPIGQTPNVTNQAASLEATRNLETPVNTAQKVGKVGEQIGEFLLPTGLEEGATKLGGAALGKAGAVGGKLLGGAVHSGVVNKAQGGSFTGGAGAGLLGGAVGEGLRAAAPSLAESALKIRGNDRLYGRTVGDAIINDTSGVRPETVAASARSKIASLTPRLEQQAATASSNGARGSLIPTRQTVADTVNKHLTNRAAQSAQELTPLTNHLTTDSVTGLPLSPQQTPTGLLQLKRGLNSDFIQNWKPDQPPGLRSSARTAYGSLADEFHRVAPGTAQLDQRVSSLIPVAARGEAVSHNAGLLQRTAGRVMAHTGAATLGGLGAAGGYKEGGIPGAIAGGLTGIVAPEMLASPTAQMVGARALNGAIPNFIVPATQASLLQAKRKDQK